MYVVQALAGPSRFKRRSRSRVLRGLRILREWMRRNPDFFYLRPGRIARDLGLGHGAIVDVGYALRYWESVGFALRERAAPTRPRYVPHPRLMEILEDKGCLLYRSCTATDSLCGLLGTPECPFLEGGGRGGRASSQARG